MDIAKVEAFIRNWKNSQLREQQASQSHFNDLCDLVGHPHPTTQDPAGTNFTFERHVRKTSGQPGRADVWYKRKFAWEYKGKFKDLDAAYAQLQSYRADLENPPLLVVCDFLEYRIYPQWPDIDGRPFVFTNEDLIKPQVFRLLEALFNDPDYFRRERDEELRQRSQLTAELAGKFAALADKMRGFKPTATSYQTPMGIVAPPWQPMQVARFLTRIVFVLFAQKIELLPKHDDQPLFTYLISRARREPERFARHLKELFEAMNGDRNEFFGERIPWFNGGLFADAEVLDILHPDLLVQATLELLEQVAAADWDKVNPTIVGTLFERALDKDKRSQLGAHYTSEADIRLIIEPVLMKPLRREWEAIQTAMSEELRVYLDDTLPMRTRSQAGERLKASYHQMVERLAKLRVLDPACGSGNFLYVSLRALKDLEADVKAAFAPLKLPFRDVITPNQFYGIELNGFAAQLARVVIWIGYLQWRYEKNGKLEPTLAEELTKPTQIAMPIIRDQAGDGEHIQNADAIMRYDAEGKPYEPEWPAAEIIVGNPPFLGSSLLRSGLTAKYVDDLFETYEGRVPGAADLVCYWFEKARAYIDTRQTRRAGLLSTNSIRGGANRQVLDRIKRTGDIFMGWSDREWTLNGAAVRVSMVGFDDGSETERSLDGRLVISINSDLTWNLDLTGAKRLQENENLCYRGDEKHGDFDISENLALQMLMATNADGRANSDVVRHYLNAFDVVRRPRKFWIIDFFQMSMAEAEKYEAPFRHVVEHVKPVRERNNRTSRRNRWWQHGEIIPSMRNAIAKIKRFIVTPAVSKHRIFIWISNGDVPDHQLIIFAREDDYFFGVLHSYLHEIWALRLGTSLEDRPRYTPTTTFETFPFPYPPGKEPSDDAHVSAIGEAAKTLHEVRDAWLNPPDDTVSPAQLRQRTLTNLYNAVVDYREKQAAGTPYHAIDSNPASKLAAQIAGLHDALDAAVLAAYGWSDLVGKLRTETGDEELLRRLLALNLERAAHQAQVVPAEVTEEDDSDSEEE